jgi:hypothetical protein
MEADKAQPVAVACLDLLHRGSWRHMGRWGQQSCCLVGDGSPHQLLLRSGPASLTCSSFYARDEHRYEDRHCRLLSSRSLSHDL